MLPPSRPTPVRETCEIRNRALHCFHIANINRTNIDAERRRESLDNSKLANAGGSIVIAKDRHAPYARRYVFQKLQPFPAQAVFKLHKAGHIAAGPSQAADETCANWVRDIDEYDWHSACRLK